MTDTLSAGQRDELDRVVRALSTSDVVVRGVQIEEREDPQERYVLVEVKLSRPTQETWAPEAFYEVRRRVRRAISDRLGDRYNVQLTYVPADASSTSIDAARETPAPGDKRVVTEPA